jgi:transketolase
VSGRNPTDLRDPGSFDHAGRDHGANHFVTGQVLAELGEKDGRVVACAADLKYVTGIADFEDRFPDRTFQFGISERTMFGAAAGMAASGLRPYVATFASFAGLLAFENVRTDIAYPGLPVRILATHAGVSMGFFGTSHHATEDLAAMCSVAGLRVMSVSDSESCRRIMHATADDAGPVYIRLSRGADQPIYPPGSLPDSYGSGVPHVVREGSDITVFATGIMVRSALDAAEALAQDGISVHVVDVYQLKPLDSAAIAENLARNPVAVTVEEHNLIGGLGSRIAEVAASMPYRGRMYKHGLADEFAIIGPPTHLLEYYGLDGMGVSAVIRRAIADERSEGLSLLPLWTDQDKRAVLDAKSTKSASGTGAGS